MIIRMTVGDNDYTEMLENFADNLHKYFHQEMATIVRDNYGTENLCQFIKTEEAIRQTLWANSVKDVTDEGKILLKARLHIVWGKYIDSIEKEDKIKEYLKKDFNCSFSFTFKDKRENGEVVYFFTGANKWVSQ